MKNIEWVKVADKFPKVGLDVLGYNENDNKYFVATYSDTYKTFFIGGFAYNNITHWQTLPQPPLDNN